MKEITLDTGTYEVVYQAVACAPASNVGQLRLAARVLGKLEEHGTPNPENGMYVLANGAGPVTVRFEDAEAAVARELAERRIPHLQAWAAVKILPVLDALSEDA